MATEVILPRVDMDMVDAKVAHWYVKDGETVGKGQVLFEIETDKATMEVDATAAGVIRVTRNEIGVAIPVGQVIGWILAPGEALPASAGKIADATAQAEMPMAAAASVVANDGANAAHVTAAASVLLRATPLARSLAREHHLDLNQLAGSGPRGRILGRDLRAALDGAAAGGASDSASDGLHLRWARHGSGTPLLLIHGFGADQGSWRPLLQQLPQGRSVIAIDLPNHGKSAASPVRTLQEVAAQVLQRLDEEGLTHFHLLGHSLGGAVAMAMAQVDHPRVRSLTLLAPAGLGTEINGDFIDGLLESGDEPSLKATMTALFHDPAGLTGSFVATAFRQLQAPERRAALAAMAAHFMPRGRQSQGLRDLLPGLRMPVQIIWGTGDRIIPMQHALDLPAHVGLHLLPAVGHLPQVEAAALVAMLVDHQLRAVAEPA